MVSRSLLDGGRGRGGGREGGREREEEGEGGETEKGNTCQQMK